MAAEVRQHRAFQVFVLQVDCAPRMVHSLARKVGAQGVGIVEAIGGELVEGGIGIGHPLFISRQGKRALPDAHLPLRQRGGQQSENRDLPKTPHLDGDSEHPRSVLSVNLA